MWECVGVCGSVCERESEGEIECERKRVGYECVS